MRYATIRDVTERLFTHGFFVPPRKRLAGEDARLSGPERPAEGSPAIHTDSCGKEQEARTDVSLERESCRLVRADGR